MGQIYFKVHLERAETQNCISLSPVAEKQGRSGTAVFKGLVYCSPAEAFDMFTQSRILCKVEEDWRGINREASDSSFTRGIEV